MKKILFIIQGYDMPSSRVRVLNLLPAIEEKGYQITYLKYPKKLSDKMLLFRSLGHFDIVFLQKKLPSPVDTFIMGKLCKKLVYDFDDAIYLKHEKYKKQKSFSGQLKFRNILKAADVVVAGNRILADYASDIKQNVKIIPSVVGASVLPKKDYSTANDKFVVGWVGGNINLSQLELLRDVFIKLQAEIPLELRVISGKAPEMPGVNMIFIPWSIDTQDIEIAKFDAGVMPLPDSPYARGKCSYKAIQYMAAAVPAVVSDVGVNADTVGKGGLVAKDIEGFYQELKYLYNNPKQRQAMGEYAAARAAKEFSIERAAALLDEIFTAL